MPNITILAQAVLQISCWQSFYYCYNGSKKGHDLVKISRNSLKSESGHLNTDPNLYVKYQTPIAQTVLKISC